MTGDAVEKIARLEDKHKFLEIDGQIYARERFQPVYWDPRPEPILGATLTGMIDYIRSNREVVNPGECMIVVKSFAEVELVESYGGDSCARTVYYRARLDDNLPVFPFGKYLSIEDFIIKVRTLFQPSEQLDEVVKMVSKVTNDGTITMADDGVSQTVAVRKGVSGALTGTEQTKGSYQLFPFRTFRELDQPQNWCLLRLKQGEDSPIQAALFDAQGETWRLTSVLNIKDYLEARVEDIPILA
ncbi:hypothetical protein [Spirochaeta africana]|uniref:Uncharacterized protein n=1 Tax=Spirochaeta africana (strain ATCC 700263 / DSM 8902 / Z-7692) TaxID=889378 RepID=H9UJF5_SPIAZ|nr:hypothetical protein [Spirochaeta africana]AFG37648.1 hypothetical protein Spiaf_1590 [Spirochaeta africana DSM 8902]